MSINSCFYTLKYNCSHEFELKEESSQDLYNLVARIIELQVLQKKWLDNAISVEDEARRKVLRDTISFCSVCERGTALAVMTLCQRELPRASSSSSSSSTPSELPADPSQGKEAREFLSEEKVQKLKRAVNEENFPLIRASLQSKAFEEFKEMEILSFIDKTKAASKRKEHFRQIISAPKPPYFWTVSALSPFLIKSVKRGDKEIVARALQQITQAQKEKYYDWDQIFSLEPTWRIEFASLTEEKRTSTPEELKDLHACEDLDSLKDKLKQRRKNGTSINVKGLIQVYHARRDFLSFIVSDRMYSELGGRKIHQLLKDAIEKRYPQIDLLFTPLTMHLFTRNEKNELEERICSWIAADQTILSWVAPLFPEFNIVSQQDILTSLLAVGNLRELNKLIPPFWKRLKEEENGASILTPFLMQAEQMGLLDQIVLPMTRSDRISIYLENQKVSFLFTKWLHAQSLPKINSSTVSKEGDLDPITQAPFVFPLRCTPCGHSFSAQTLLFQESFEKSLNHIGAYLAYRFREGKFLSVRKFLKNRREDGALTHSLPQCPLCSQEVLGWVSEAPTSVIQTSQKRIDLDFIDDAKRALVIAVLFGEQDRADQHWETIAKDQRQGLFFESILPFLLFSEIESMQKIFAYFSSKNEIRSDHLDLLLAISGLQGNEPSVRFLLNRMEKVQGAFVTFVPEIFDLYEATCREREFSSLIEEKSIGLETEDLEILNALFTDDEEEDLEILNSFLKDDEEEHFVKRQKTDL